MPLLYNEGQSCQQTMWWKVPLPLRTKSPVWWVNHIPLHILCCTLTPKHMQQPHKPTHVKIKEANRAHASSLTINKLPRVSNESGRGAATEISAASKLTRGRRLLWGLKKQPRHILGAFRGPGKLAIINPLPVTEEQDDMATVERMGGGGVST